MVQEGAMVLDVRTTEEYNAGHVAGSVNIPLDILPDHIAELKERNKKIIAVCRSGARSGAATGLLTQAGLEVVNGGGWDSFEQAIA